MFFYFFFGRLLYLIEILHQTTTPVSVPTALCSCILSKFYIKPQLRLERELARCVVSYRNSTSNHNSIRRESSTNRVVSYRNSTSNHNTASIGFFSSVLYLIEILHQTTTINRAAVKNGRLYLIEILHQTTTGIISFSFFFCCILSKFYIKPQHRGNTNRAVRRCILSKFYIKPQRRASYWLIKCYLRAVCHYKNTIGCSDEASLMHFPYFKERK